MGTLLIPVILSAIQHTPDIISTVNALISNLHASGQLTDAEVAEINALLAKKEQDYVVAERLSQGLQAVGVSDE
jgi:Tfp pilus assembly protein PilN